MRDSEAAMSSSVLPSCPVCGAGSWVITLMAPVYVTVDGGSGRVGRVRVNDEAVDVRGRGPVVGRADGRGALVTCGAADHMAPDDIAAAVLDAADADGNWPGWEWGA